MISSFRSKLGVARQTSQRPLQQAINCIKLFYISVYRRVRPRSTMQVSIQWQHGGKSVPIRIGTGSDETVFREIFIEGEYRHEKIEGVKNILDLGANVGYASIYLSITYPDATVYAIEPDPLNIVKLKRNVALYRNIKVIQCALGPTDGTAIFFSCPGSGMSTSTANRDGATPFEVNVRTLDSIINTLELRRIDFLKFDIEGAEYSVFQNCALLSSVHAMMGEVHSDLMQGKTLSDFIALLNGFKVTSRQLTDARAIVHATKR